MIIRPHKVSVLFNEPKLLKLCSNPNTISTTRVSVLFNEPKLLKFRLRIAQL